MRILTPRDPSHWGNWLICAIITREKADLGERLLLADAAEKGRIMFGQDNHSVAIRVEPSRKGKRALASQIRKHKKRR